MAYPVKMRDQLAMVAEIFLIFFHSALDLAIAHNSKISMLIQRKAMFAESLIRPILENNVQAEGHLY